MCGILGQIERERPVELRAFERMLETLASRGPDGSGVSLLDRRRVALGHQRLSILDLSEAASQPMPNEDATVWLVFNGEIYNYRALREELERAGHRFESAGDSEVIVHAYEEWGDACVRRLRGIFAFGIWDEARRRLLLARDPLGVKPLYTWRSHDRLVFASQPRAILEHPEFRREVDLEALQHYLAYRYVPGALAIFEGMDKLPAGHLLVAEGDRVRTERYWQAHPRTEIRDPREAEGLVREKLEESVHLQLASDVPVGLLLSGGIDSSSIGAVAARALGPGLPCFTIGFEDPSWDERPYARLAAEALGGRMHEEVLGLDDAIALIPTFAEIYDEPFFDHSGLPSFAVSSLCRRHEVPVVLAGDGGDELFAGYNWYDRFLGWPRPLWPRRVLDRLRGRDEPDPLATYFELLGHLDGATQRALLPGAGPFDHLAHFRKFYRPDLPAITALQWLDLQTFLVDDVLTKLDRASMRCGVEARVPLLDPELVELAFRIDHSVVFADGERKALLKRAVADWLPGEILSHRKKGFSIPLGAWMQRGLHDIADRLVTRGSLVSRGVFGERGAADLLAKRHARTTWLLLAAELWARRWLDGEAVAPLQ